MLNKLIAFLSMLAELPVIRPFIALLHSRAFLSAAAVVIGSFIAMLDPRLTPFTPQIIGLIAITMFCFLGKMSVEEATRIWGENKTADLTSADDYIKDAVDSAVEQALHKALNPNAPDPTPDPGDQLPTTSSATA